MTTSSWDNPSSELLDTHGSPDALSFSLSSLLATPEKKRAFLKRLAVANPDKFKSLVDKLHAPKTSRPQKADQPTLKTLVTSKTTSKPTSKPVSAPVTFSRSPRSRRLASFKP